MPFLLFLNVNITNFEILKQEDGYIFIYQNIISHQSVPLRNQTGLFHGLSEFTKINAAILSWMLCNTNFKSVASCSNCEKNLSYYKQIFIERNLYRLKWQLLQKRRFAFVIKNKCSIELFFKICFEHRYIYIKTHACAPSHLKPGPHLQLLFHNIILLFTVYCSPLV